MAITTFTNFVLGTTLQTKALKVLLTFVSVTNEYYGRQNARETNDLDTHHSSR